MTGTKFERTSLVGANLSGASMKNARLYKADLSGAVLTGVTGLRQPQLDDACGDKATRLPKGLTVPACR